MSSSFVPTHTLRKGTYFGNCPNGVINFEEPTDVVFYQLHEKSRNRCIVLTSEGYLIEVYKSRISEITKTKDVKNEEV